MVEAVLSPRLHHNSHACELWCHGIAEPGDAGRSPMTIVYLLHGILTSKVIKVHCYKPGPGKETPYMMLLHRVYGQFLKINV